MTNRKGGYKNVPETNLLLARRLFRTMGQFGGGPRSKMVWLDLGKVTGGRLRLEGVYSRND